MEEKGCGREAPPPANWFESGEQRFHADVSDFLVLELKQIERLEIEKARDQDVRELLDAYVVDVHALVVELATVGDAVFQTSNARE